VARRRSPLLKLSLVLAALALIAAAAYRLWMPWIGYALVHDDGPAKADIAVVLAGDFYGHRMEKAGDLVRAGYVPAALVSGPEGMYGVNECDLAIPFAVRRGYPAEWFIPLPNKALSTREEARVVLAELRRRRVGSFLLVTSDFHSARANRIFRATERAMGGPPYRVVASRDEFFRPDAWWHSRESLKRTFEEWCKTVATAVGI
jgi:uncharacterized SAM-binding protein YcdF (DUF218 family)